MRTMLREQQLVASAFYEMSTELERLRRAHPPAQPGAAGAAIDDSPRVASLFRHADGADDDGLRGAPRMLLDG